MERKITNKLAQWKNSAGRKPLVLYGARQTGKTYSILSFGKANYKNMVYINFEGNEDAAKIFERNLDTDRIIKDISSITRETVLKNDTLIFFDEIQACEKALTSLKYFCENNNEYHIIAAGSLLGVAINREKYSFPVGKVDFLTMFPLDFEEFLMASGYKSLADDIRESYITNEELTLHGTAMDLYREYLAIGGMPAAVKEYIDKKDYDFVMPILKSINDSYVADMAKYASRSETAKIMEVYNSIPSQLSKDNKKFQYKIIKTGARAYDYDTPIDWLVASGVIQKCVKVKEGKLPLIGFLDMSSFKIYMTDVGLLSSRFNIAYNIITSGLDELNNYKGLVAENYVCSALAFNGIIPYYWEANGKAEVDFMLQTKSGDIIPVEVKSSDNVRSKSLSVYINKYNPSYSIRISAKNFGFENNIKSVPLYAVFCISTDVSNDLNRRSIFK